MSILFFSFAYHRLYSPSLVDIILMVFILCKYSASQASLRCRLLSFLQLLKFSEDIILVFSLLEHPLSFKTCSPICFDIYLKVVLAYANRIIVICRLIVIEQPTIVFLHEEILPFFPKLIQDLIYLFLSFKHRIVYDVDDGIHLRYLRRYKRLNRALSAAQFSDIIFTGSPLLKRLYKRVGASSTVLFVPGAPDHSLDVHNLTQLYPVSHHQDFPKYKLHVAWVGSPSTQKYILPLINFVSTSFLSDFVHFHLTGVDTSFPNCQSVTSSTWSTDSELEILSNSDIGIMPLFHGKHERYKCSFKLLQYLAMGLPSISSPVGFNRLLQYKSVSLTATTYEDWLESFYFFYNLKLSGDLYALRIRVFDFYKNSLHPSVYLSDFRISPPAR